MYVSQLTVLWISEKNGNGILLDSSKNEIYVDSSITGFSQLNYKDTVSGSIDRISGVLCCRTLNTKYNTDTVIKLK